MRKRVFYNKVNEMKYISHLDMINFLERLLKIAGIKPSFTQGFHPRPKMTFGNALPLGMESYNDIFEFETEEKISDEELLRVLREKSPIGFEVVDVKEIGNKNSIVTDYNAIIYEIDFVSKEILNKVKSLINSETVIFKKEKNGKVTEKDLKPKIRKFEVEGNKMKLFLEEISPKYILELLEISSSDVNVKRTGYCKIA